MRLIALLIFLLPGPVEAQPTGDVNLDSIRAVLKKLPADTAKVDMMTQLMWDLRNAHPDFSAEIGEEAIALSEELKYIKGMLKAMSFTGVAYRNLGNYPKAFDMYFIQLEMSQKHNSPEDESYANINIANLYIYQKKPDEAIKMLKEALRINKELKNKKQEAYVELNLGRSYILKEDYENAENHLERAILLRQELGDSEGMGIARKYMGDILFNQELFSGAFAAYSDALQAVSANTDKDFHSDVLNKIALIYIQMNDPKQALVNAQSSLSIATNANVKPRIKDACGTLGKTYALLGEWKKAFDYQSVYIAYYDSLSNDDINNRIADIKFEIEKKQKEKEHVIESKRKETEIKLLQEQERANQTIKYAMAGGLVLFTGLMFVLLRTSRIRKQKNKILNQQKTEIENQNYLINKQKEEVELQRNEAELQKQIVEEKNKEILDSITYAKRIQTAILPTEKYFKQHLPDSFVMYLPKDIVAGDFYWLEKAHDWVLFAAADCTGHGVPGAMVSVVCNNALNRAVREYGLRKPGEILNKTRQIVIQEFSKSESAMRDGMDISLCALSLSDRVMHWAGANNPVWIINESRKNWPSESVVFGDNAIGAEIKGDKQPIGSYAAEKPFANHSMQLEKGDTVYIFTDGFQDQFGGNEGTGKKYKAKKLKDFLISIRQVGMMQQRALLIKEFETWRKCGQKDSLGNSIEIEQLDDVCIIGVRIE